MSKKNCLQPQKQSNQNDGDTMEYICPECGHNKVYVKPNGRRMGVYCADCNTWITWCTYKIAQSIYEEMKSQPLNDKVALRKIAKRTGITTMRCSKCDCLLYNSSFPKVLGQFDLVNARFCPTCGRELL